MLLWFKFKPLFPELKLRVRNGSFVSNLLKQLKFKALLAPSYYDSSSKVPFKNRNYISGRIRSLDSGKETLIPETKLRFSKRSFEFELKQGAGNEASNLNCFNKLETKLWFWKEAKIPETKIQFWKRSFDSGNKGYTELRNKQP